MKSSEFRLGNEINLYIKNLSTFHDPGTDFSAYSKLRPSSFYSYKVVCLDNAGFHRFDIHWSNGAQIYHLKKALHEFCYDLSLSFTAVWVHCPLALCSILTSMIRLKNFINFILTKALQNSFWWLLRSVRQMSLAIYRYNHADR